MIIIGYSVLVIDKMPKRLFTSDSKKLIMKGIIRLASVSSIIQLITIKAILFINGTQVIAIIENMFKNITSEKIVYKTVLTFTFIHCLLNGFSFTFVFISNDITKVGIFHIVIFNLQAM